MMESSTTESASSSLDDLELSDSSDSEEEESGPIEHQFSLLPGGSSPQQQQLQTLLQPSNSSSVTGQPSTQPSSLSLSVSLPTLISLIGSGQARGRSLRNRRLRGHHIHLINPSGDRIRDIVRRRPRCGFQLLRSLKNDKHYCIPEPRSNPDKPPRQPGRKDLLFTPKDGDLLLHHVKQLGKRVVEFFDAEQPPRFEEGDYLLRFKLDNYSFVQHSFVTTRGYLYHHGNWVYLGKDANQMELA